MLWNKNLFATIYSTTFRWTPKMCSFFKDKFHLAKAVARRCSVKKVLLKVSQSLQGNTFAGMSLFLETLLKVWLQHWCFFLGFTEFSRKPILQNTWERLLRTEDFFLENLQKFQKIFNSYNEKMLLIYIIHTVILFILFIPLPIREVFSFRFSKKKKENAHVVLNFVCPTNELRQYLENYVCSKILLKT